MPFGDECQFQTFSDCEAFYRGKVENESAYCAALMEATEEHCNKRVRADLRYVAKTGLPKESVNYREATDEKTCGACLYFQEPAACEIVDGTIEAEDTCDLWVSAKEPTKKQETLRPQERLVWTLFRYHEPDILALQEHLFTQAKGDFAAAMREQLRQVEFDVGAVEVTDRRMLARLNERAAFAARSIAVTHERQLVAEIRRIAEATPKANRRLFAKRLAEWERKRNVWHLPSVAVTEMATTQDLVAREFIAMNNVEGRARVTPDTAAEPVCQELVDRGWMPLSEATAIGLPVHVGCPHSLEIQIEQQSIAPLTEFEPGTTPGLWVGGTVIVAEQAAATA